MEKKQPILYYNDNYEPYKNKNQYEYEYQINENINLNPQKITILPKGRNVNIKPTKKEKERFTSIINPRLPKGLNDLSYDQTKNK